MMTRLIAVALMVALPPIAAADQFKRLNGYDVHYVVIPTQFLEPEIASRNGLVRGQNRSLVNISVLDGDTPVAATLSGSAKNLLGQSIPLEFAEVREGPAIYYLATLRHSNEEVHRFTIEITPEGARAATLEFQQQLFWAQ